MTLGRELVFLHQHLLCLVKFSVLYTTFCMFVKFSVHGLCQCIKGLTHFGMSRGAKTSLALNAPK